VIVPAASQILSELVLVSSEAAVLTGTSATLQKGEVYTVLDLLYGMMLPSGNDAAAALAEYLGDGFSPPEKCRDR
jgi:serine-type D-Ala-D-Ala carboxypeptidase (penicillin-binding protein 5/6)